MALRYAIHIAVKRLQDIDTLTSSLQAHAGSSINI